MKLKRLHCLFIVCLGVFFSVKAQNISLYNQYNGNYDFVFIGNTLNLQPNGAGVECLINTSADATLNLNANDEIVNAYLYWAGSGNGDFDVQLNGINITAQRQFNTIQPSSQLTFFAAFADVTSLVQTNGNGNYTLSELDLTTVISPDVYCRNGTNFGGWAIIIVYRNPDLPLNQINVYDGLQSLSAPQVDTLDTINFTLDNLNVIDNIGAEIGFVAWEGDATIANQESLSINGNILSNSLNPSDNAFNGTNTFTGSSELFNMDLDVYNIEPFINVGDTEVAITIGTAQDFVMLSAIVTKLNNQLPDATVLIDSIERECDSRIITVDYSVSNTESTDVLPANTPIAIYVNNVLLERTETDVDLAVGETITRQITLLIPDEYLNDFNLKFVVDDIGDGTGIIPELSEVNNAYNILVSMWVSPVFNLLEPITSCNEGLTKGTFNFSNYDDLVKNNPTDLVTFHETIEDANAGTNDIISTSNYIAQTTPRDIFVRIENEHCYNTTSFTLLTRNCPPTVYNYVSVNNDTVNDEFFIAGLKDIFLNYKLEVYNRWGKLLWTGNNNIPNWDGYVKDGIGTKIATDGTYYYFLYLNDIDYPTPLSGFLYINH